MIKTRKKNKKNLLILTMQLGTSKNTTVFPDILPKIKLLLTL